MQKVQFGKPDFKFLEKDNLVVDMHTHTNASHDCNTSIKKYVEKLKSLGIGAAITDHDEAKSALIIKRLYPKLFIIPGMEATSKTNKHLLFYFHSAKDLKHFYEKHIKLNKNPRRTNALRIRTSLSTEYLLDIAKDYNALRIFAHPMIKSEGIYGSLLKRKDFSILKKVDGIEVINATQSIKQNKKSLIWADYEKMGMTGGSDSHITKTMGNAVTYSKANNMDEFLENIRKKKNHVVGHTNSWYAEIKSLGTIMKNKLTRNKSFKKVI